MLSFIVCCPLPPSPGTHGEPVAVCSADLWILPCGLWSLFHLSVFLNLDSKLIFITDVSWSTEIHSTQNILFGSTGSLLLLTLIEGHYFYAGKDREEGHSVTNPNWNDAKNYWCFMWNKGRKTVHINQFTSLSASRSDPSGLNCSHLWTFYLLCSTASSEVLRWS